MITSSEDDFEVCDEIITQKIGYAIIPLPAIDKKAER